MALESSQRELQDFFRPCPNPRSEQGVMDAQSPGSLNRDSFGTPPGKKCHLDVASVENTIWGKVVASLESEPW